MTAQIPGFFILYNEIVTTVVTWYWKENKFLLIYSLEKRINKMVPEAVLDDCEERKALWRIQVYELSYPLRYISLVNHSSSCYEGCQSDKCFQIHFRQVVLCFFGGLHGLFWGRPFFFWGCGVDESIFGITWFCHLVALTNSSDFRCS